MFFDTEVFPSLAGSKAMSASSVDRSSIIPHWYYHCNDDFADLVVFGNKITHDENGEIMPMAGNIVVLVKRYLGNPDIVDPRLTEYQTRQ